MPKKARKRRVPQLKHTDLRGIGWHVSYRDPQTGSPKKHRFGVELSQEEAEKLYHQWVADFLAGEAPATQRRRRRRQTTSKELASGSVHGGSLLEVASGLLTYEEGRVRGEADPRRQGTITRDLFQRRKQYAREFLEYLNERNGDGAVGRLKLADLTMEDVEQYNRSLIQCGYSQSQVAKRMRFVKNLVDRAGRPEHGQQTLAWNWDSRDVAHGRPAERRKLPTLPQISEILKGCGLREEAMVWLAIGCGLGQRDLASIRVGQIDRKGYDLRRGKTGVERYGETPPRVWSAVSAYNKAEMRSSGDLLFITRKGCPIVHEGTDSVAQWWQKLRRSLGTKGELLGGFYTLRHLGATEFGSRPGTSIGDMKRWLGHSASSQVADVYMKPVSPESRAVVEWVRKQLAVTDH